MGVPLPPADLPRQPAPTPIVRFLSTRAGRAPPDRGHGADPRRGGQPRRPPEARGRAGAQARRDALTEARQEREVTIDWLDPATPKALRLALQKGEYHILHFVGHSGYVDEADATRAAGAGACSSSRTRITAPRRCPMPSWSTCSATRTRCGWWSSTRARAPGPASWTRSPGSPPRSWRSASRRSWRCSSRSRTRLRSRSPRSSTSR